MQLTLDGYTGIAKVEGCSLNVTVSNNVATITYDAQNGSGVDMRSGVAVLTMKKSGASQSITSEPKAIASKDANGALSPITQPNVTDDPLGGFTKGDVDMDGRVAVNDAVMVLKNAIKLMELDTQQLMLADADNDGKITVNDAVMILKKAIKLIDF